MNHEQHSWMTQEQPGQWRASKLDGLNVYNQNNEKIGDISELIVDSSGTIQAVVVGVGGFLGLGERDVAIPFDQIKFVNEPLAVAITPPRTRPECPGGSASPGRSNGSCRSRGRQPDGTHHHRHGGHGSHR